MSVSREDLDSFHQFAIGRIDQSDLELTFDDLIVEWDSQRNRAEINAAIRQGLEDVEAGRTRPASEVLKELRRNLDSPQ
jgi:hypothetical protein